MLLIVSLFLDWYEDITGFTVFEFLDLLLVVLALATIASLAGGLGPGAAARPRRGVSLAVAIFTVYRGGARRSSTTRPPWPSATGPARTSASGSRWPARA